jgi:HK97 family phage portal protein
MFNWGRRRFEQKTLDVHNAWALIDFGRTAASGITVTPEVAWRCPIVRGAIAILSESIAQLPLLVYEVAEDGSKGRATAHPLYSLLHDQPNDFSSSYEFRRDLQTDVLLHGHAFAYLGRSRATGQIVEIIRIDPRAVTLDENDAGEPLYYVTDKQRTRRQIDRADILHITATGRRSPIEDCREAIGLAIAMERHQGQLYGNGCKPGGILRLKGRIPPATLERLQQDFAQKWGGLAGSGKTLILEDDAAYEGLTFTSTDLQHLELRRFQVSEIARAFRIPPHMLADLERTTHNNAEEMGQQFLQLSLLPHIVNWEQALRRALLTPAERERHAIEFLTDGIARAALAQRYEAFGKATAGAAWMTANEARARENLAPIEGGDALIQPLNMTPSDEAARRCPCCCLSMASPTTPGCPGAWATRP